MMNADLNRLGASGALRYLTGAVDFALDAFGGANGSGIVICNGGAGACIMVLGSVGCGSEPMLKLRGMEKPLMIVMKLL